MRVLLALVCLLPGCAEPAPSAGPVSRASFGVFYGSQIQEREEIPFELDRAKQLIGLRLEFTTPLSQPRRVRWELDKPADRKLRRRGARIVELGQAEARAGIERFDQALPFKPGDPLGTWNVRALLDDVLVIDRPFLVYDARSRDRAERAVDP